MRKEVNHKIFLLIPSCIVSMSSYWSSWPLMDHHDFRLVMSGPLIGHHALPLEIMSSVWSSCPLFGHHVLWLVIMSSVWSSCPLIVQHALSLIFLFFVHHAWSWHHTFHTWWFVFLYNAYNQNNILYFLSEYFMFYVSLLDSYTFSPACVKLLQAWLTLPCVSCFKSLCQPASLYTETVDIV